MTQPIYAPNYYTGNGSTDTYSFNFFIPNSSRLAVYETDADGVETLLTFGIDYSVDFVEGTSGLGSITLTAGNLTSGYTLAIHRNEELTQDTQIGNLGPYFQRALEDALDKLTRIAQQLEIQVQKSLRLPATIDEADFSVELPADMTISPGAGLIVNATGDGITTGIPAGTSLDAVSDTDTIDLTFAANTLSADLNPESVGDSFIDPGDPITRAKIATGSANRLVVNGSGGALEDAAAITASKALVSDANGIPTHSAVTATELGYLSGASGTIQTAIDAKMPKSGGTFTGAVTLAADPVSGLQPATKQYADSLLADPDLHLVEDVRAATFTNGTFATAFANGQSAGGVTLATNDRLLLGGQTAEEENGLYIVQSSGAPVRSTDADDWDSKLVGLYVGVTEGTFAGTSWKTDIVAGGTLDTDPINFFYYPIGQPAQAGDGLSRSDNTLSVVADGSTVSVGGSGVKVADGGVTDTQLAGGHSLSKLATLTANKLLVSSAGGVISASSVTSTEAGHLSGVTSAVQTQLDAKIASTILTTNGDILARIGGVVTRLPIGSNGEVLGVSGGALAYGAPSAVGTVSVTVLRGSTTAGSEALTMNAWTPFTLSAVAFSSGSPFTRSTNDLTPAVTGKYYAELEIEDLSISGTGPAAIFRIRNTTTGATVGTFKYLGGSGGRYFGIAEFQVSNISHVHQIQYYINGGGGSPSATMSNTALGGETGPRWSSRLTRQGS